MVKAWEHYRTESLVPSDPRDIHKACRVTVYRIWGEGNVRYGYTDYTTLGEVSGRDDMPMVEFEKAYPVREEV